MHVVAGQGHTAVNAGGGDVVHRQAQLEAVVRHPGAGGVQQCLPGQAGHRGGVHVAQRLGQRPFEGGSHLHRGVVGQVGDAGVALDQLQAGQAQHATSHALDVNRCAAEQQLAAQPRQRGPQRCAGRLQKGGHIGQLAVLHLGGNAEVAQAGVGKRDFLHRPVDLELHVGKLPLHHRVAHVMPGGFGQHQRQVAVHARAVGAAQAALQVNQAG